METTKLIVEYLIMGILICLSIIFLVFNISPNEAQSFWLVITQYPFLLGAGGIAILLPIAYGIGTVVEYLGVLPYEGQLGRIKEKRFQVYVEQNRDWLTKEPLFKKHINNQPILKGASLKLYGEMRFFVLMNNAYLYQDIERQINQVRILRVLSIVEIIFTAGLMVQLVTNGVSLPTLCGLILLILLIVLNIGAILYRFNHYCRAVERAYKVLSLDALGKKNKK
jgi:hypothetical protein